MLLKGSERCLKDPSGRMLSPTWPKLFPFFFFFQNQKPTRKATEKKKKKLQLSILSSFNRVDTNSQPTSTIQSCHLGRGSRGAITVMTQISRWIWTCINGWLTSPLQASQRENSGSIVWRVPSKGIFKQSIRLTSNYLSRGSRGEEHPRLLKRNQFQGEEKLPHRHHHPPNPSHNSIHSLISFLGNFVRLISSQFPGACSYTWHDDGVVGRGAV